VPLVWFYCVLAIPFLILVFPGGWKKVFESGDASVFVWGVIIACIAENIISHREDRYKKLKKAINHLKAARVSEDLDFAYFETSLTILYYVVILVLLGLNIWFAVSDKLSPNPSFSWAQFAIFLVTIFCSHILGLPLRDSFRGCWLWWLWFLFLMCIYGSMHHL